jgi:hypothetical protein
MSNLTAQDFMAQFMAANADVVAKMEEETGEDVKSQVMIEAHERDMQHAPKHTREEEERLSPFALMCVDMRESARAQGADDSPHAIARRMAQLVDARKERD